MGQGYRIIGLSLLLWSTAILVSGGETKNTNKTWDDYKLIAEKNIFSRNRTKVVPVSEARQPVIVIPEQTYYTLRGITKQSDGYISFIEDERTMAVTKVRKGEKIGGGKVINISLDDISFEYGGKTVKVEIGMTLERQKSNSGAQYYPSRSDVSKGNTQVAPTGQPQQTTGQPSGTVQSQTASQSPLMWQAQSAGQTRGQAQPQTATKAMNETVQGNQSGDVLQRLKERRKKELEE